MNFPYSRHSQRYEYACQKGYFKDKVVADVGCGNAIGTSLISIDAKMVFAIDPRLAGYVDKPFIYLEVCGDKGRNKKNIVWVAEKFNPQNINYKIDVVTLVEVFEHIENPEGFLKMVATHCENVFITTPLANVTGKTRNLAHVAEYSMKDFDILEKKYQTGDMNIVDRAEFNGDSFDHNHTVQMVWARSRYAKT